jgi:cytoskeleton protein RodZ
MSAQSLREDEQQPLDSVESTGKRLRIARQAKGMSQNDVASHLHLSRSTVQALESDDYDGLPDPVFVRGYIRNYARLLGLDNSAVMGPFNQGQSEQPQSPAPIHSGVHPEIRSSHFAVRLVSWLIVIGLIGLIGAWWQGHLQWNGDETTRTTKVEAPDAPLSDDGTLRLPEPDPEQTPEQLPQIGNTVMAPQSTAAPSEEATQSAPKPASALADEAANPKPEMELNSLSPTPSEPDVAAASQAPDQAPEPETASGGEAVENQVVFEFTGPCWVDIRDASRKFKIFGEMKEGDRKILEGTPPYSIILGNSSNVRIQIKGRPFDIDSISRGGVARFTLDPNTAD